jgi:hypothetical protein
MLRRSVQTAVLLLGLASSGKSAQILTNGTFEGPSLSGWAADSTSGMHSGLCGAFFADIFGTTSCGGAFGAIEGKHAAYVAPPPAGTGPWSAFLGQQIDIPANVGRATLSWYFTANVRLDPWSAPLVFEVRLHDGGPMAESVSSRLFTPGSIESIWWERAEVDITEWARKRENYAITSIDFAVMTLGAEGFAAFGIDDVRLEITPVPEPASLGTVTIAGLVALRLAVRRRL